jgi:hypothetical protein
MVVSTLTALGAQVRRTIRDPVSEAPTNRFATVAPTLALLRAYADNSLYEDVATWQTYRSRHRLPRSIRSVYNPASRAISWYCGHVFRGAWTEDGAPTPWGAPHLLRIPSDVLAARAPLILAALQCLAWGNWQSAHKFYVSEGATVGSTFVEVVDDLDRRKVYPEIVPVERVADLLLDASGNVKEYELDYQAYDRDKDETYRYRKRVTGEQITVWRDERIVADDPNPYGFAPGVWVKHRDRGGIFGAPVIDGVIPKIDEANRLATGIHNYVAKLQSQPQIIASATQPTPLASQAKATETLTDDEMVRFQELIPWMWTQDVNTKTFPLMQPVPIEGAAAALAALMAEIEADLPEVTLDRELRSMSQVTGPGAERLVSDTVARLEEAQANYLAGTVKVMQMGTSIGGWRFNTGAWGRGTDIDRRQAKFAPFSLDSYNDGLLDLMLAPAPLFDETETERFQALAIKKDVAGLPDEAVQEELGYDEAARARFGEAKDRAAQRFVAGEF